MENSPKCSKVDLMTLLPLLLDNKLNDGEPFAVTPSSFMKEMVLTTEERLEKLKRATRKVKVRQELSSNTFKAVPDIVIFQNFEVGGIYTVPLTLLNTYEVSKALKIIWEPSPSFKISHSTETVCTKVAPGMTFQFNVTFSVSMVEDYKHKITFATDGEVFEVPLIAIAPRPLLDLPDFITVPTTPVKVPSERTILVRNLGKVPAVFNVCCEPPYFVSPNRGMLEPNQCMQLSIQLNAKTVGSHSAQMFFTYQTGEQLMVGLYSCSIQADVYLDKKELQMTETFMGLKTREFIRLVNKSNNIIHFQFKVYKNEAIEKKERSKYLGGFEMIKNNEQAKVFGLMETGIVENRQTHENIYERIYVDELHEFETIDQFIYKNPIFEIFPNTGKIWPNNDTQILVIFSPIKAVDYESVAYLDVTGREERIPLKLRGSGMGPLIQLNVEEIDANQIFLCAVHQYEITVRNIGDIPTNVKYFPTKLNFGGDISFTPERCHLEPDDYASFVMQFCSNIQGKFVEEIKFVIEESDEIIKFIFKGDIVCPLLNFDMTELSFQNIPLGFVVRKCVHLINTTQVPIEFNISIEGDGHNAAVSCEEYARCVTKPKISEPKEFTISHVEGVAMPNSTVDVEVSLLPNKEGRHSKELKVQMWKSNKYSISLPIKYYCHVPHIVCETKELLLRGCFINYFYNRTIVLKNKNSYCGYFVILPQEDSSYEGVIYLPKISESFIESYEEKEVEIEISTNIVGQAISHVFLSVFGEKPKFHLCTIVCNGQGPVLSIPDTLNFGNIKTLKNFTETIEILNDSPVMARVTICKNSKSVYEIEERDFNLEPSGKKDLKVKMYIREPGTYIEKIFFDVENSEKLSCILQTVALGSSLLSKPELDEEYDFGRIFTYQRYEEPVRFTNLGSKHHKIIWSRKKTIRSWRNTPDLDIPSVFSLVPNRFELAPGQSIECMLTGQTTNRGRVEEDFYCHALVGNKKEFGIVTSFIAVAEFVSPVLELSKDVMEFRIDRGVNNIYEYLSESLFITNKSRIPVVANITIEAPFYIVQDSKRISLTEIKLEHEEIIELVIEFVPVSDTKRCMTSEGSFIITYNYHPHKIRIILRGEENYPNIELEPRALNFGCLPNFFTLSRQILMRNISPLPVSYHWEWIQDKFQTEHLDVVPIKFPETPSNKIMTISKEQSEGNSEPRVYEGYEINVPEPMEKLEPIRKSECFKEIQVMLYQLVAKFNPQEDDLMAVRCMYSENMETSPIQEILELIPSYGYLGPFECQSISVEFSPCPNSFTQGIAHCHIAGGDVEVVPVSGKSANISFSIDKSVIDFGITLFCDVSERRIELENTGFGEFRYRIRGCLDYYNKSTVPKIYSLFATPTEGVIQPKEKKHLQIKIFPGLTGEFTKQFTLEVAYFNPYTITVHGYAVPAQMICSLPRPSIESEEINLHSYGAISAMTEDFLNKVKCLSQTVEKYESDISPSCENNLQDVGWVIITHKNIYPSIHDIDLAINGKLINEYLLSKPSALEEHLVYGKLRILSQFSLMPYLVDFGYVIRDTVAHYTVLLENYGPIANTLRMQSAKGSSDEMAFEIHLTSTTLKIGDVAQLFIVFHPITKLFPMVNQEIKHKIYLLLSHGPRIPIEIKAFLTLPEITVPKGTLTFESIVMGNCMRKTISLENNGFVTSKFVCKVHSKSKPLVPFYIKIQEGSCEPGECFLLNVYFEPKIEGKLRGSLVITVEQNQTKFVVNLKGTCVQPFLKITESHICFPPTLPYMQNVELFFTVENVCPFPIEYLFADFDEAIDLEEQVMNLIMEYYNAKQVYLPVRTPGSALPNCVLNFYYDLLNKVKEKIASQDFQSSSTINSPSSCDRTSLKKKKSSRLGKIKSNINSPLVKYKDPLLESNSERIEEMLYEQLAVLKQNCAEDISMEPPDPVKDAIVESHPPDPENGPNYIPGGILIIFHGSYGINCSQIANKVGLNEKLPVYNVDQLFFDALMEGNSLAAIKIGEIIVDCFMSVASETDLINPPYYDGRDELQKKIDIVSSGKPIKTVQQTDSKKVKDSKSPGKQSKSSLKEKGKISSEGDKSSKESKKNKVKEDNGVDTLVGIPEDFLFELLQVKLRQFKNGLIIESLDSAFLRRPMLVLDYLLKGIGNIRYIHCIILSQSYNDFIMYTEAKKQREEELIAEMKKAKAQAIAKMDQASFQNLSAEDKELFKQEVLVPRKLNMLEKREQLKLRLELKNKHKREKPAKKKKNNDTRVLVDRKKTSKSAKESKDSKQSKPNKISKISNKSSKDSKSGKEKKDKITDEELDMKKKFSNSEKLCSEIMHVLEFWDRKNRYLTKPLLEKLEVRGASRKSNKSSNKSSKGSMKTIKHSDLKILINTAEDDVIPEELARQIGIPCWYFDNVHSGKIDQIGKQILFYLQHTLELENAKIELNTQDVKRPELPMEIFSCVSKPARPREKHISNIFTLTNQVVVKDLLENKQESVISRQEITTKDSSKVLGIRKRKYVRRSRSRQSTYSDENNMSFISPSKSKSFDAGSAQIKDVEVERKLISRNILNPGEIVTYCAAFLPKECGFYRHSYAIELVGWPSKYEILLEGSCDIPKINMKETVLFDECVARKEKDKLFEPNLYVMETGVFDFGSILMSPAFICTENLSVLQRVSAFHLENISSLPCEATLYLKKKFDTTFQIENNVLLINPNEVKDCHVSARPEKLGANENQLLISIKNNPRVQVIDIRCVGCEVDFRVDPRTVSFERGLLNVVNRRVVKLCNESLVPLVWKISDLPDYFEISDVNGRILPCSKQKLEITFKPDAVQEIPRQELAIKVYDGECKLPEPIFSDVLAISAEVINIDVDFPSEINFGEVKGKMEHTFEFPILSKVKYDIEISFLDVAPYTNYYEHEPIRRMFNVTPQRTILKCDKIFCASVSFFSKHAVDFENIPIIQCEATDPIHKCIMKSIIVKATAKTYLSSYELCPPEEMYFGHQLIGTEKSEELFLRNAGKFEFTYTVLSVTKILEQKEMKAKTKGDDKKGKKKGSKSSSKKSDTMKTSKSSKTSKDSKIKGKQNKKGQKMKTKAMTLDVGCFSITSSSGVVEPNENVSIKITSRPKQENAFEEKIIFFISESANQKGHTVTLTVKGTTPKFNFQNFSDIFNEHYVVNTMEDFACPEQLDFHCVFIRGEQTLYFNKVCINTTVEARMRLQNVGLIPIELISEVTPKKVFSVKTAHVLVEPFDYGYITLCFTPNEINIFSALLEVTYEVPSGFLPEKLHIQLSGEGFIPEIAILDPKRNPVNNAYQLSFNPTLVGKCESKTVCYENCGMVACKIILEICQDTHNVLSLKPTEWSLVETIWNTDVSDMKHTMVISLHPKQKGVCEVEFKPESELKLTALLKANVVNNPFEVFSIQIKASSFLEDIVLEGLPTKLTEKPTTSREVLTQILSRYELDFGFCAMNALQKKCFKIKNCSELNIYRFEFTNYDKLIFIPAVGHLKPSACKEVLATFLTREPVNFSQEILDCVVCKIEYVQPQYEALSWDQRQNLTVWDQFSNTSLRHNIKSAPSIESSTKLKSSRRHSEMVRHSGGSISERPEVEKSESATVRVRKLENRTEPEYLEVPESSRALQLSLSIIADYCSYECNVKEIVMDDTLMFEKRSASFLVTNTSIVPLYLEWNISMDEGYPRRINTSFENLVSKVRSSQSAKLNFSGPTNKFNRPKSLHLSGKESFLPDECTPQASTKCSLFSSSGSVTSRTNDSWCEQDLVPFTITPATVKIPGLATQNFTVTFSPNDVFQYVVHLKTDVQNSKSRNSLDVIVSARSLLPHYHFDLEPSNYLRKNNSRKTCTPYEDKNIKIVEFEVIGLGVSATKSFRIINPTRENFEYKWIPSELNGEDLALFQCHTPKGEVTRGKMAEAVFSFLPREVGTFEAFYTFLIEKYDLKTSFLLVGTARNSCAFFSKRHLKLKPTILTMDATDTILLKNNENLELGFEFMKTSLYCADHIDRLLVKPSRGSVTAHSEVPIQIMYRPVRTGEVAFCLKCNIELMNNPLNLTVTANCFDIQPDVVHINEESEISLNSQEITNITLNSLVAMKSQSVQFMVKNKGKIGFYFAWSCKEKFLDEYVKLEFKDDEGYVVSNRTNISVVLIKPIRTLTQKRIKAKLQIRYGPSYSICFVCTTVKTKYKFSFSEYDFGPCLLQRGKTAYYKCCLEFTNYDTSPLFLECTPEKYDHLSVMFTVKEIAPKKVEQIIIYFHPLEIGTFTSDICFFVNSKPEMIKIRGEGVPISIEVEDSCDKVIDFGPIMIGKNSSKTVKVANKSVCSVHVIFNLHERLPYFTRPKKMLDSEYERDLPNKPTLSFQQNKKKKNESSVSIQIKKKKKSENFKDTRSNESKKSDSKTSKDQRSSRKSIEEKTEQIKETQTETEIEKANRLIREFISVTPRTFIKLLPGGKSEFSVKFSPKERMRLFSEKICYQVQDYVGTICIFKASCIASDYYLSRDKITFGNVIKGSSVESKFTLYNIGDMGGKYTWRFAREDHPFTITPMEGYLSPDTSVTFTSKFQPLRIECLANVKGTCSIEHFNKKFEIVFTGTCVDLPLAKETLQFTCPVRSEVSKDILINNPTNMVWYIIPILEDQFFCVPEEIKVEPYSSANCQVTYKPKRMTFNAIHKASLYLKISNGSGMAYNLEGKSEKPLPLKRIEKNIFCKTYHTEVLEVQNWLNIPQRFKVISENLKSEETIKQLYKLTGNTMLDVPAKGLRNYKWIIYVLNEGSLQFNVSFVNDDTQEYLLYEIHLNVIQCESIEEITLQTCARVPVLYRLKLENSIKTPVTFFINSESNSLHHEKLITVPPLCEYFLNIEYLPLLAGETKTILEITSGELGKYPYTFHLISRRPVAELPVHMKTCLGQKIIQKIGLYNSTKTKAEFAYTLDNKEQFSVNLPIIIGPEQKGFFEVTFEPDGLGNYHSTLTLNSSTAGEYTYPLIGTCIWPKPQGPVLVRPDSGASVINFKNPFKEILTFTFTVEPKEFYMKAYSETMKPKTTTKINIFLQAIKKDSIIVDTSYPLTGKFTVTCVLSDLSQITWVYYLQADFDNNSSVF